MTEAPAVTDTRCLVPSHPTVFKHCTKCSQSVARWAVRHPRFGAEQVPICAACFFRHSGWPAKADLLRVRRVVAEVSAHRNVPLQVLERDDHFEWSSVSEADDVLGKLVFQDRMDAYGSKIKASSQGGR